MCIRQNSVSFSLAMTAVCATQVNLALACMMLPRDFDGRISQRRHQAILIHHGNREELILRVNYKITGDKTPSHFAWIITTPSEPSAYHLADEKVFRDTGRWATKLLRPTPPPTAQANRGAAKAVDALREPTLEFGKREVIGPYDIQPVRARGSNALQALNEWLAKNGFPKEDPGHMKYFIDQEFTFLCVKINPADGVDGVASTGVLPPLHLSFESERPYYPLLFSSRQGVFDVEAAGRGDVFQVDATEARGQRAHGLNDDVVVLGRQADGERVDVRQTLEQDGLALHDRHRGLRADVAQPQHRGTVSYYRHGVGAVGQVVGL